MPPYISLLLELTQATAAIKEELIQSLWSGYGQLLRVTLEGGAWPTVIVKLIAPPKETDHPRGWNTDIGHQRKLRSYDIEANWYQQYAQVNEQWRIAQLIGCKATPAFKMIVLEDLDAAGFPLRHDTLSLDGIKTCLSWLAHFHAAHLGRKPEGLWPIGTYWHLDTRPEELNTMPDGALKANAAAIDQALNHCHYQTIVHGDAKLANFCFAPDGRVAAVDFQYVGGGCGMKDVAYFISSCLYEEDCERYEQELLAHYFGVLQSASGLGQTEYIALEQEWRKLYPYAWADFVRFLQGWMPGHRKLHGYSRRMVEVVLGELG